MANTIQKKIKFSKGQIVPELVERTDLEIFDSSAQKMHNVVSSVYGGVRSRRGTQKIDRIFSGMTEVTGTATSGMGGNTSYIQDKNNRYVSGAVGTNRKIFQIQYGSARSTGTLRIRGIKIDFREPKIIGSVGTANGFSFFSRGFKNYSYYYYSGTSVSDGGVGITSQDRILPNPETDWTYPGNSGRTETQIPSFSFSINSSGKISSVSVLNGGKRTTGVPSTDLKFKRNSKERNYRATAYCSSNGSTWIPLGSKVLSETEQDFDFNINTSYQYVKFELDATNDVIQTTISMQYASLLDGAFTKGRCKLVDYFYNNQDKYVLVLTDERISIYKDNELRANVLASGLLANYFDILKWTYKDDTVIFTHPNMSPKILKHLSDSSWTWGDLSVSNIPFATFTGETTTSKSVGITPSAEEGAIKITADSNIFDSTWVGQYIDGNGGRFKVTEYISGTVVNGYTTIPFYTKDKITSWNYISGYEQVWSSTRGWPRTCLFAQQRLWFGGSRDKPATVWASRLGDYFNFKNSGNYDNDSIDVDLLTNDIISNMVDNRGIHILTTGQELTASEGTYTPDKIAFTTNTQNGSLTNIRPAVISGYVCFVEKNGKSLLSYVYNYEQASYLTDNLSLFCDLVESPVSLCAEINSSKDKGDFIYMVLSDGTMLVGCVSMAQNIMSLSKFKTDGKIIDVCSVGGETFILVDRGTYNYLEKIEDVLTDVTTDVAVFPGNPVQLYGWEKDGVIKYTKTTTPTTSSVVYNVYADETSESITAVGTNTITIGGVVYKRENTSYDTMSIIYQTVLSDYNGLVVYLYEGNTVYERQVASNGRIELHKPINKTCKVGIGFKYEIEGNPIAINHKTTSVKKRITTADVLCENSPVLRFCGQEKKGKDQYKFYSCTKYGNDVRYNISGEFYPLQILSIQLNINYEG